MSNIDLTKIKGQTPVSIIVHGGNYLGYLLSKTLLEQGSQVVIIDKYTAESKEYFSDLRKSGKVSFIDFKGLKNFYEKISRIDYLFYLLGETLENQKDIDSKDFLSETDYLGSSLNTAQKYKAKITLLTSLRLNRELANRLNNNTSGKSTPYSPLELQRYGENFVAEFVDKTKANLRIIRLGTVVGKGINKVKDNTLDKLFIDATQKPQIEIVGEGLELHNLIHESDAVYGILKLTFDDKTKGEVITLCNNNDYTTLSLSYKLLELDVEAKAIRFVEDNSKDSIYQDMYVPAPNASTFSWKQRVSLEESIVEQVKTYYERSDKRWDLTKSEDVQKRKEGNISSVSKTKFGLFMQRFTKPFQKVLKPDQLFKEIKYTTVFKYIALIVLSLLTIYYLIAPLVGLSLGSYLIYSQTDNFKESLATLDFNGIKKNTSDISTNLDRIESNISRLYWLFKITGNQSLYNNSNQIIQGSRYALDSAEDLTIGLQPLGEYIKDFQPAIGFDDTQPTTTREYREYLLAIDDNQYNIKEGIYKMTLAQSLINSVNTRDLPKFLQNFVLEYKGLVTELDSMVRPLEKISQFLPDLLGVEERMRYLILLQNDGEIRSTGGWITSYAIVAIENGQIRELFVDDIYNAEGTLNLKGYTYKTPVSMIKALGQTPYTFSLVNWDPNLDSVLTDSEQFIYDLGKGNDIDGIFTMDTVFLQKLLDKWGGIEVPGESEIITSSNLYSKIFEMHSEFVPGSTRKSTFLANLANESVTKLLSSNFTEYKNIADVISESLEEKHLQATFKNTTAKAYFDSNNWDGNLDSKYQTAPINIDWNWGGNKANLYIKKNHTLDISIKDENTIDYKYQIAVQNESLTDTYPEGQYTNYVRIYIPANATLMGITGIEENKYDIFNEGGYKIVGGWFNVPIKENRTLEVSYRLSRDSNVTDFALLENTTHYQMDIDIYKQPGSRKDAYNLTISYPLDWTIEDSDTLSNVSNQLNGRFELATDVGLNLSWQK